MDARQEGHLDRDGPDGLVVTTIDPALLVEHFDRPDLPVPLHRNQDDPCVVAVLAKVAMAEVHDSAAHIPTRIGHESAVVARPDETWGETVCAFVTPKPGVDDLAERVQAMVKPEIPVTLMEKMKKLPELAKLAGMGPKVGKTGNASGTHLHYEVLLNGIRVNPEKYILN